MYKKLALSVVLLISAYSFATTITEITAENAKDFLTTSDKPVIVEIYAEWCQPCKEMAPLFEQLAQEAGDQYVFAKLNYEKNVELAQELHIEQIPTFLVIKPDNTKRAIVGLRTADNFKQKIEETIKGIDWKNLDAKELEMRFLDSLKTCSCEDLSDVLQAGVNPNMQFADGSTPLLFACINGAARGQAGSEMINRLLDAGADVDQEISMQGMPMPVTMLDIIRSNYENMEATVHIYKNLESKLLSYRKSPIVVLEEKIEETQK